ncbi:host cell division inhibitor Icd-like protein [Enterobacter hormaechei]|uniref:host cell division inhibitor Icd-like protein n=1 Tax=Enterobacter cloacae complex TaxID=354276 RepID=UPI002966E529|nr:host cell division inhibitor Icd-like protein [Enterobacter cloacae complex sp. 2023EL-01177]MDW2987379.1 host cell division inhibitor Icd-like protein [Enterobacter cloacae complex sp. 2023EL-01177]
MIAAQIKGFPLDSLFAKVMVQNLAKLSLNLTKPDIQNLSKLVIGIAGMMTNDDAENLTKPNIRSVEDLADWPPETVKKTALDGLLRPVHELGEGFSFIAIRGRQEFKDTLRGSFRRSTRAREGEFLESIKKGSTYRSDHQRGNQCYSPNVAAKSATGIETPNTLRATQTPKASFFVSSHYAHLISGLVRTVSMVALVGLRSRRPVSFVSGSLNPANVTANHDIETSGGDSLNTKEAAAMLATIPTQNPQFIWLIAAVRRDTPTITAKIHHIAAETEKEARRSLAQDHVCFFAGRIRLEVAA